ncbi:MAG: hypothetical protein JEZ03_08785 [Bacteroidales bacterium]|nr:hypothetical protein [Bacteroidales bacterium]
MIKFNTLLILSFLCIHVMSQEKKSDRLIQSDERQYVGIVGDDQSDYYHILKDNEDFHHLQSVPSKSNFGEIQSVKAIYDFVADTIYYINLKKYPSHYLFAKIHLNYKKRDVDFLYSQYTECPSRYLHLITINYHKHIDKYVFEFFAYDQVDCQGIEATYRKLLQTSFFDNKLYFYANNLQWKDCKDVPKISSEELFNGQNYQALNAEECYGFLRKIDIKELQSTHPGRHDIVLLNGIPNDLSVVSGVITSEFQTPLSHINILSHNRRTPNMALRNVNDNQDIQSLMGELIYLRVEPDSFVIRKASLDEAKAFWDKREAHCLRILEKDTESTSLVDLQNADIKSVKTIGGKAANFAELVNLGTIPVPENHFAIPFYYYQQHMQECGAEAQMDKLLKKDRFYTYKNYRKKKLKEIRDRIKNAPLDPVLLEMVLKKINYFNDFSSYRFRSSTNAEDIEDFSGAGLYDSYSARKNHKKKTVEAAIKKVWASLWKLRAFDEREYYKIDQRSIAMGILVHRSFPNEDANGVVVAKNLYNVNHAYTINAQYKEHSIVKPEAGIIHDQILTYTINFNKQKYTIEYLTQSNVAELKGQPVLSDDELYLLADYSTIIKKHYYGKLPNKCNCKYEDFAVDIEFKVDSELEDRKIYIKQVRIYPGNRD